MGLSESHKHLKKDRTFLFLQGPLSPFFRLIADALERRNHRVLRINLCFGDWLFWRRPGAISYRGSLKNWPAFITAFMQKEGVTDLLLLGEQRDYHKIAIRTAQKLGIDVTVTDFGYLRPDWITFERDGMTGNSIFPRDPDVIHKIALSVPVPDLQLKYRDNFWRMVRWDMLYHLSSSFMWPLYPLFQWHHVHHPILVYMGIGLHLLLNRLRRKRSISSIQHLRDTGVSYFVYPLQMQNDFSIRAYSHYDDQREAIREVLESFTRFAPEHSRLIIRVHPLDPMLYDWQAFCRRYAIQNDMQDRIKYIDGGSLDKLLHPCRGVVTINSTVGIWTLLAGLPLKVLGEAVYDINGLTFQGKLDKFWTDATPPDPQLRNDFIRAIAGTIQIRGVYYNQPGLNAAVAEAVERLDRGLINQPLIV